MEKNNFSNLKNKDKLYKQIFNLFPINFYQKFKKIIIGISITLLLIVVIYLIVATYLNINLVWYCCSIPIGLFLIVSLLLTQINVEMCIKKFKTNLYLNQKDLTNKKELVIVHIKRKQLFNKRTNFILEIVNQVYNQLKNLHN